MNDKKKFRGGLKLLLLVLFMLLLGISSTCYASISQDFVEFCIDGFINSNLNSSVTNNLTTLKNSNGISSFTSYLNEKLLILDNTTTQDNSKITDYNAFCTLSGNGSNYISLLFIYSNCTFDNGISDFAFANYNNSSFVTMSSFGGGSIAYQEFYIYGDGGYRVNYNRWTNNIYLFDYNHNIFTTDGELIEIKNVYNYAPTQSIYVSANSLNKYFLLSSPTNTYLNVYPPTPPEPEEPSGDVGGGTVTPSGDDGSGTSSPDYTNQLNNINTSIDNVNNSVQDVKDQISGDTKKITNSIDNLNNTITEYDTSAGEDDVSDLIDNIQSSLSGDLSNSEIFGALEESEKGFLDLISGQAEDFEIHWNDVIYNGVKLIPAGQVNFSALCRENSTLGNIKEKLNIILSALCGLALIKYLYNLLLATLGIDNPYLYDTNTDSDYIKSVDKNTGITTFSGVDKDGTRWHYTYNPKKGGKKK